MTCRQLRPYVVDFARGAIDAAAVESQVARHVRGCPECRALLERERIMSAALQRMADEIRVPPGTVERECALLALFDEAGARPRRPCVPVWLWSPALAAVLLFVVVAGWRSHGATSGTARTVTTRRTPAKLAAGTTAAPSGPPVIPRAANPAKPPWPGRRVPRPQAPPPVVDVLDASFETTSFVAWPGANEGPPLESGSVIRVRLPVSILPALGLWPPPSAGSEVPADVLVGQDGFARAVRLVSD